MVSVAASSNMVKENGVVSSQLVMGSQPGFLTLSPSRAEQLVAREPLERWYTVENQPFARGKFAAVKRCRQTETGEVFAAKVIRKRRRGAGLTAESLHEAATLDLCRSCPHIVRLEQVFDAPGETVLVLQLAEGGELQSVLDRDEVPEERDVIRFLNQVLGGLAHLHQFDIAHLDLKPQNLVLTGPFPNCDIKLCDFGIARHIARGADVREILGTPDYVAPEVLNYEPISLATDMWSVGVLAYVLLTGCTPFGGDSKQETFCNITRCQLEFPEDLFQDVSPAAIQFISCLLVQDPSARLTAQQCLEHPWLRGGSLLDSMHMVISSSPSDSCPVSRSSTIVPDDDDDDDVARCFRDDTSSTSEETIVCGGSNRLGTPTGDPPPEAETELLDAETLSLVSAAAAASCRAADVVDTPGAPAVAATAAATAATAPNRDEDELKRSEVKSKLLAVREDFGLAWLSPKTTPSASAMKKQHLDYVSPPAATSSAWSNFGVTRRTGSLPSYRWRTSANAAAAAAAANRREASCDRTSDLGYGSDGVSEISSTDSSSDRSSIISLDDSPLEWANHPSAPRRYSDTSLAAERLWRRTWERFLPATAGTCVSLPYHLYRDQKQETGRDDRRGGPCQQPGSLLRSGSSVTCSSSSAAGSADPNGQSNNLHRRPWEKLCTGSLARAMERFNSPPPSSTVSSADGETAEATSAVGSSSQSTVAAALSTPLSSKVGSPLKVSEVRTRLLRSSSGACLSRPSGAFRTGSSSATYIKAPLLHLDQTEIVKSRLVKFRTAQATTSPAASAASATAANAVHPPSS